MRRCPGNEMLAYTLKVDATNKRAQTLLSYKGDQQDERLVTVTVSAKRTDAARAIGARSHVLCRITYWLSGVSVERLFMATECTSLVVPCGAIKVDVQWRNDFDVTDSAVFEVLGCIVDGVSTRHSDVDAYNLYYVNYVFPGPAPVVAIPKEFQPVSFIFFPSSGTPPTQLIFRDAAGTPVQVVPTALGPNRYPLSPTVADVTFSVAGASWAASIFGYVAG